MEEIFVLEMQHPKRLFSVLTWQSVILFAYELYAFILMRLEKASSIKRSGLIARADLQYRLKEEKRWRKREVSPGGWWMVEGQLTIKTIKYS
jgi:hypothetical protein